MFGGRIGRGWAISKQSWNILRQDPVLLPFPLFSGLASLLVLASFILPVFAVPGILPWLEVGLSAPEGDPASQRIEIALLVGGFAFYLVNFFVIVFFNTALAACVAVRFRGETPTVAHGLKVACSRLPQILAWTFVAATVGIVLRSISERSATLGRIVVAFIGAGWTVATFLVVPTLAVEGLGPIAALKRSASLISASWGEGLAGNMGLSLINVLLILPFISMVLGGLVALSSSVTLGATILGMSVLYFMAALLVSSAMKQVFVVALYFYAAEKHAPAGFSADTFEQAFRKK